MLINNSTKKMLDVFFRSLAKGQNQAVMIECENKKIRVGYGMSDILRKTINLSRIQAAEELDIDFAMDTLGTENCCNGFYNLCNMWSAYKKAKEKNPDKALAQAMAKMTKVDINENEVQANLYVMPTDLEQIFHEAAKQMPANGKTLEKLEKDAEAGCFYALTNVLLDRVVADFEKEDEIVAESENNSEEASKTEDKKDSNDSKEAPKQSTLKDLMLLLRHGLKIALEEPRVSKTDEKKAAALEEI